MKKKIIVLVCLILILTVLLCILLLLRSGEKKDVKHRHEPTSIEEMQDTTQDSENKTEDINKKSKKNSAPKPVETDDGDNVVTFDDESDTVESGKGNSDSGDNDEKIREDEDDGTWTPVI